jgi:hypothetical protein
MCQIASKCDILAISLDKKGQLAHLNLWMASKSGQPAPEDMEAKNPNLSSGH